MKKILMVLAVAGLSTTAMAQSSNGEFEKNSGDKYEVVTNKFFDNWFMSAGVGAEMLLSNSDAHRGIGKRISPTFNVGVGKWFTPGLGLRLQYSGYEGRGYTKTNPAYVRSEADASGYYRQKFHYMNLHGDVLFNLNALIGGYNPDRVYEIIPYLGAGFTHSFSGSSKSETFAVNAGLINRFRLSPVLDLNLELGVMGTENKFDRELGGKNDFDGTLAATIGLTYHFKERGFKKPQRATEQLISEAELRAMRDRMNQMANENQNLRDELANVPEPVEQVTSIPEMAPRSVFFNLGSAKLSKQEEMNLGFFVDQLKECPQHNKFNVIGYADSATGSKELNQKLSEKRAQAVVDALVKTYNVDRDMFTVEGRGGVDTLIPPYLNRMVLIEPVK